MTPEDDTERVRRLLKELPKVPAAPDFEARLQRRLAAERTRRAGLRWLPRPAYAYSALAVAIVGFISYLALERAGVPQRPSGQLLSADSAISRDQAPPRLAEARPPETAPPSTGREQAKEQTPPHLAEARPPETAPLSTGREQAKEQEPAPALRKKALSVPPTGERRTSIVQSPPAKAAQAPVPALMQQQAAAADVRSETAADFLAVSPGDTLLTARERAIVDSVARYDSVKADSLRKAFWRAHRARKP